jgi:hypothetical protein
MWPQQPPKASQAPHKAPPVKIAEFQVQIPAAQAEIAAPRGSIARLRKVVGAQDSGEVLRVLDLEGVEES